MDGIADGELETAGEMAAAITAGEVSSVELVERSLRRAHAWQPVTNAFSQFWDDEATARGRASQRNYGGGPAAGVPLAVKDLFDVADHETTGCSRAYAGNVADGDAAVIARLRAAGTIFIGKTNQHELAAGGSNAVSACGPTANPWDATRITGGSSGGSGAAVAAGVVPWALGSDTGGSIRIPSSMCGTFGLKPTTGQLSLDGVLPLAPSLDCPGPIAATAADLRLLYEIMAGRDTTGSAADADLEDVAIGVPDGFFAHRIHGNALQVVDEVARTFERAGARVDAVDGTGIEDSRRVWSRICYPEFAAAHPDLRDRLDLLAPQVRGWIEEGLALPSAERENAARRRQEIRRWFAERLQTFDALLIPTTPYPAPPSDAVSVDLGNGETVQIASVGPGWLTCSVNVAGFPAVNLPAGKSPEGLPIGVSLVGIPDDEPRLLRLAARWEAAAGYTSPRPALLEAER